MLTITKFFSATYYLGAPEAENARVRSSGCSGVSVKHLSDGTLDETAGVWLVLGESPKVRLLENPDIFARIKSGEIVEPEVLRALVDGKDPRTHQQIGRRRRTAQGKAAPAPGGYDLQFSLPKSVSMLVLLGDAAIPGLHKRVADIHSRAVVAGLTTAMDLGWIVTRKDGHYLAVSRCVVAYFRHGTSRDEDMQMHGHYGLLKSAELADGSIVQLDNYLLKKYAGALAAIVRCEEVRLLRQELRLAIEPDRRNYRIAGMPLALEKVFSKRQTAIADVLTAARRTSGNNRVAAQKAAYETRRHKKHTALTDLKQRWLREASEAGWTSSALLASVAEAAQAASDQSLAAKEQAARLVQIATASVKDLTKHEPVFSQATLLRTVFEAIQCEGAGHKAALRLVLELEQSGLVERVASVKAEPLYTMHLMREAEQDILRVAVRMAARASILSPLEAGAAMVKLAEQVDAQGQIIRRGLNGAQAQAFTDIVTGGGLILLQGAAGTGKTFLMRAVKRMAEVKGIRVFGTAPAGTTTEDLRSEVGFETADCQELAKMLGELESGHLTLDARSLIIVDDAGGIGTRDMHHLLDACDTAGAHVLLHGDALHYRPASAGAPFAMLGRILTATRLAKIEYQQGRHETEGAWMCAASVDLSKGQTQRALEGYDRAGLITWLNDKTGAISQMLDAYVAHRTNRPDESRAVTVQWNRDAMVVSNTLRQRLRAEGFLAKEEVVLAVLPRGKGDLVIQILLSVGDEIVFGEQVDVAGVTLCNADLGTVTGIEGKGKSLRLFLKLEKTGVEIAVSPFELVGFRNGDGKVPALPRLQYAYALTGHSVEGVTVDALFDLALRPRGQESTYVCVTRHRREYQMFVDVGRLAEEWQSSQSDQINAPRKSVSGRAKTRRSADQTPALEHLKRYFFDECTRDYGQGNISDDIPAGQLCDWAEDKLPRLAPIAQLPKPKEAFRHVPPSQTEDLQLTVHPLRDRIAQKFSVPDGCSELGASMAQKTDRNADGYERVGLSRKIVQAAQNMVALVAPAVTRPTTSEDQKDAPSL